MTERTSLPTVKALALALLVCTTADSVVVDIQGKNAGVIRSQSIARMAMRQACPGQRDAAEAWTFYEVRGAESGGTLTLYNRGRAFDGSPPCELWGTGEVGRTLHGFWNAPPTKVDSAAYVTPSGVTYTFTRR